jgi:transcriptional regulator of PTS gene
MKINQQFIKNSNLKLLYSIIRNCPGTSRVSLAKATGLSKTTVSSLVEELIKKEFLIDGGTAESSVVGRRPKHLYLTGDRHCAMVINWAPGSITAALIYLNGSIRYQETVMLEAPEDYSSCLNKLILKVRNQKADSAVIIGTCIILSAMIDRASHKIISTTLHLDPEEPVVETIRRILPDEPLAFLNDTACLAYAEKYYSSIEDNPFAFINLDQGIGAAIFVDGKLFGDASGMQTQFGHYSVDPNGRACACGNRGCLEVMIGEKAAGRLITDCGSNKHFKSLNTIRFTDIGTAAKEGDPIAVQAISTIADYLSAGLSNFISLIRPSSIVIGGSGTGLGDEFLCKLKQNIKSRGFQRMVDQVQINYSNLGGDACLLGAMQYFFNYYYSFTDDIHGHTFLG